MFFVEIIDPQRVSDLFLTFIDKKYFFTSEKTDIKDEQVFIWRTWSEQGISCQSDSLSLYLSVSHFTPSLSTNLMQEKSTGALQVHPFFIWRLTTLASSSLDWDPVLSQKVLHEEGRGVGGRLREGVRERRNGEREVGRRRKFSVGGEGVYARVCERDEKTDRDRKGDGEGNGK